MMDGTTPTMASMGVFPGVFTFIPFVKIGEKGAQGDNTGYSSASGCSPRRKCSRR